MPKCFGERLRECRKAAGLTQQGVAVLLGVTVGTVVRIEMGRRPDLETAIRVAEAFGQSLDWLVLGRGKRQPVARIGSSEAAQ